MRIQRLELINFRNYHQVKLSFDKQINVILGNNAHGKTNLLESICLSATGKSHRTHQDTDLVYWNEPYAIVRLHFDRNQMEHQIEISITPDEKRMKLDGKIILKRSKLLGQLAMVLFTPDDLSLIKGEPSHRRKFLDFEISQTRPVYLHALQRYYRALKQRNMSIKDVKLKKAGLELIHVWDSQLAEFGSILLTARQETISRLNESIPSIYSGITGNNDTLQLIYQSGFSETEIQDTSNLPQLFLNKLQQSEKEDINRGVTITGPQRDDIKILLNGRELQSFGSQGEQRTAVLALKLAEIEFIKNELGEPPIVALDDFMSELDDSHITYLLNSLSPDTQTFITAIHPLPTQFPNSNTQYFQVTKGEVRKS